MNPKVSVLMPVYNTKAYVAKSVESILAQTLGDFELLIVDDGSDDETRNILDGFTDSRIKTFLRDHAGISATRNFAVNHARGEYIANMDSDDFAEPDRLQKQVGFLDQHQDVVACSGQALQVDPDGLPFGRINTKEENAGILKQLWWGRGLALIHSALMARADAVKEFGYDESLTTAEDLDLYLKLTAKGQLANLPDVLISVTRHLSSTTAISKPGEGTAIKRRVLEAAYRRTGQDVSLVDVREFSYPKDESAVYLSWIETAMAYGYPQAKRKFVRAFIKRNRTNPRQLARLGMQLTAPVRQKIKRAPGGVWRRLKKLMP